MRKITTVLFSVCIVLLSGCAHFNKDKQKTEVTAQPVVNNMQDIQVDARTNPKTNLSGYKTYAWLGAAEALNDPTKKWQPPKMDVTGDVKYLIDRELRQKGINSTTVDPDLAVAFVVGVDMDALELKDDPATEGDVLENIPQGALIVVLIDVETGYAVWVGVAKANIIEGASSELVRERLDYAVSNMFDLLK